MNSFNNFLKPSQQDAAASHSWAAMIILVFLNGKVVWVKVWLLYSLS